ncbi:MAG TPA: NAD(P)/FAD-dependent oxidoreductase [Pyrinomonadaceae bacterium]|nr:NAD(P)/FAD-dependent oxidoreductase [Pyrinomonadaceae bacterium]
MSFSNNGYDVIIAGAGPAGSSLGIRLARVGLSVLLVEQKRFPRPKLCGEFISPECWRHFKELGVAIELDVAGGTRLRQSVFYSKHGRSVFVPSHWLEQNNCALGLSRAEMDNILLVRARECGVHVLEGASASGLVLDGNQVRGISVKTAGPQKQYLARITVDATGRSRVLTRWLERRRHLHEPARSAHVAFKAHLRNTRVAAETCEIYFYPGGYGGLNDIEAGLSNLCFIVSPRDARVHGSEPEKLITGIRAGNRRASYTLEGAEVVSAWLAVSLEGFGVQNPIPASGMLTVGDAAAFIDPFTGSGMLMALECAELAAAAILNQRDLLHDPSNFWSIAKAYHDSYMRKFKSRLRVSALLRRAAFFPGLADAAILATKNQQLRQFLAKATRSNNTWRMGIAAT